MSESIEQLGEPYCGNCSYVLTGATDSSKCPECGLPLVDVLMRPGLVGEGKGKRFTSRCRIFGRPVLDIAIGPRGEDRVGRARGFIAIGTEARGILAIGGQATGLVAIGGFARGGFTFGGMSLGLFEAFGGMALGTVAIGGGVMGLFAQGGAALGGVVQGGTVLGWVSRGGLAMGIHTIGGRGNVSAYAQEVYNALSFFFGGSPMNVGQLFVGLATAIMIPVVLVLLILGMALWAYVRDGKSADGIVT